MNFSIDLIDSDNKIYKKILSSLLPEVIKFMNEKSSRLNKEFPLLINNIISNTPEYQSILSGQLKYEFGIPDSSVLLTGLLNTWISNIFVQYKKPYIAGNKIVSSFSIAAFKIDFTDVLNSEYAFMQDTVRNYSLPWLEWLVLDGTKIIVPEYSVVMGPSPNSRTGNALMRHSAKSWSVPSEFAGTLSDNWITRAIDNSADEIDNLLTRIFSS